MSPRQHLTCFVIDDSVAVDAGSLAMAASKLQQNEIRDVVLTHAHLDHIAGLPLFIDDHFSTLTEPITVYATQPVIDTLERDIFNWSVYPRFSELSNANGPVLRYESFGQAEEFTVKHLTFRPIDVNHKVPSTGFLISDTTTTIALSGDTAETDDFWEKCNTTPNLKAVLVECAFPDELVELATVSDHLTPRRLAKELEKLESRDYPVFVINMKPMYRDKVIREIQVAYIPQVEILTVGKVYDF